MALTLKPSDKCSRLPINGNKIEFVFDEENEPDYISRTWTVKFVKTPRGRSKQVAQITETFDSKGNKLEHVSLSFDDKATTTERSRIKNRLIIFGFLNSTTINLLKIHRHINSFWAEFI